MLVVCVIHTQMYVCVCIYIYGFFVLFFVFLFCFLGSHTAYRSSRGRGRIRAPADDLYHSYSNTRFKPHLRPTPQLTAMLDSQPTKWASEARGEPASSWILVRFISAASQWELCVIIIWLRSSFAESFPYTLKVSAAMTRVLSPPFLYIFLIVSPFLPPYFFFLLSVIVGKTNWLFSQKKCAYIVSF